MRTPSVPKARANKVEAFDSNSALTAIMTGMMLWLGGRAERLWEPEKSKQGTEMTLPVTSEPADLADCLG